MSTIGRWFFYHPVKMFLLTFSLVTFLFFGLVCIIPKNNQAKSLPIFVSECSDNIHTHIIRASTSSHMEAVCPDNSEFTSIPTGSTENIYFYCKCK